MYTLHPLCLDIQPSWMNWGMKGDATSYLSETCILVVLPRRYPWLLGGLLWVVFLLPITFSWSCPRWWTGPPRRALPWTQTNCAPTGASQGPHVPASPPPTTCGHSLVCGHRASSECPGFQWWFSRGPDSLFLCLSWKQQQQQQHRTLVKNKIPPGWEWGQWSQPCPLSPEAPSASWTRLHPGQWA